MKKFILSTFFVIALPTIANADGAYKWKDADGNTHYGNNPPSNATNVEKVSEMGFSHYSGSKVLERYQPLLKSSAKPADLPAIPIVEEDLPEEPKPAISEQEATTKAQDQAQPEQVTPPTEPDSFIAKPAVPPAPASK